MIQQLGWETLQLESFNQFIEFVASDALNTSSCYWGCDLAQIRSETKSCKASNRKECSHPKSRICDSAGVAEHKQRIQTEVNNNEPVCRIKQRLSNTPFTSNFLIIRFIADDILPSSSCYYGYDLKRIRSGTLGADAVDESIVDFTTFHSLYALNILIPTGAITTSSIQGDLCSKKKVCDVDL